MNRKVLLIISGPTASGESGFAIDIAKELKTEILSADSRQVYRELKIGVAVPDESQLNQSGTILSIPIQFTSP